MPKRIESKTSRTAEFTCMVRCLSYLEKQPLLKTDDYISLVIMNSAIKRLIRFPFARKRVIGSFPSGMYEYVIARTKYIDEAVKAALEDETEQILILGAGFDSRGIRFHDIAGNTKIFELDAPVTQNAKLERYKEKGISVPDNLIFIPVDFDKQSISDRFSECGFERGRKSLIVMEGLTMYLQAESIDSLFKIIQDFAGEGSRIVFDFIYGSVLSHENLYQGEKELVESTLKSGESFCFGLEKENVPGFLSKYGFKVTDISDNTALDNKYFRDDDGRLMAKVNGTHCLVSAARKFKSDSYFTQ
jgi:methyltransferase (TIGR00027 family)